MTDVDEIASPTAVSFLRDCFPFGGAVSAAGYPSMYVLEAWDFEYGAHCLKGTWSAGPHAFSVAHLLKHFAASRHHDADRSSGQASGVNHSHHASVSSSSRLSGGAARPAAAPPPETPRSAWTISHAERFASTRMRTGYSSPTLRNGGWHFSGFGSAADTARKFGTWSHADLFLPRSSAGRERGNGTRYEVGFVRNGYERQALDVSRISRCARLCLSAYPEPRFSPPGAFVRKRVPPCLSADDRESRRLPGERLAGWRLAQGWAKAGKLPGLLLQRRHEFHDFLAFVGA